MTFWQKLLTRVLPGKMAEDMEAESRSWMMRCPTCGKEKSVWEAGGIRWKAAGNPSRFYFCRECGKGGMTTLYRKESGGSSSFG